MLAHNVHSRTAESLKFPVASPPGVEAKLKAHIAHLVCSIENNEYFLVHDKRATRSTYFLPRMGVSARGARRVYLRERYFGPSTFRQGWI